MKISIITSVYNNKATIENAIISVLEQSYKDIEYIVVDGASIDGTVDIINKHKDDISIFISEKDEGIYDGLNKGINLATGDIIAFLHSDDIYATKDTIRDVMRVFDIENVDSIYGDLVYVDKNDTDKIFRYWKSGNFTFAKLKKGWMPPHPTFFLKKTIYDRYGKFDTSFKIAADYDLMLRMLGKHKISTAYIPEVLYKMRVGGTSNKSIKNIIQKSKDDIKALKTNNIGSYGTLFMKNAVKLPQFFKKR